MKRLIAATLVVLMIFTLAACGAKDNSAKIQAYIDQSGTELIESLEASFATASGMTCTSSIKVEGNGFIIAININEFDNVDEAIKTQMQTAYDSMQGTFDGMLTDLRAEVPEVEYFKIQVCEKDGDVIATIHAKK